MTAVTLCLISHTNVGKTTLARTLLQRDVGEIRDAAHVTLSAESYTLIETPDGEVLELMDTPGFGDSVRLLHRLEQGSNALGWFLSNVWDRFTDRAFFCSQQALRAVRDRADVVLYLANAAEDAAASAYVESEMRMLDWLDKPIVVLLNQLGPPAAAREAQDLERWRARLASQPDVRAVLAFDAFARCWVHEHVLLDAIAGVVDPAKHAAYSRLADAWQARSRQVFGQSMSVLARQLATTATDSEALHQASLASSARAWLGDALGGRQRVDTPTVQAMARLAERLDAEVRRSTGELIALHGLSGQATGEVLERVRRDFAVDDALDPGKAGLIGAAVSGALGGLAADLAAGGLTLGAGALVGALVGAAGSHSVARAYNLSRGTDRGVARWSPGFLEGRFSAAVLRYLAVAHYGRGRGDYVESECPPAWKILVEQEVARARDSAPSAWPLHAAVDAGGDQRASLERDIVRTLTDVTRAVLGRLYPEATRATLTHSQRAKPAP